MRQRKGMRVKSVDGELILSESNQRSISNACIPFLLKTVGAEIVYPKLSVNLSAVGEMAYESVVKDEAIDNKESAKVAKEAKAKLEEMLAKEGFITTKLVETLRMSGNKRAKPGTKKDNTKPKEIEGQ